MEAVGDDLAGEVRLNQHRADRVGVAVVEPAHGVEHVRRMPDSGLHALDHVFVACVGVACLQHNAEPVAEEREFAHTFELGRDRHADDVAFRGIPEALHEAQVHRPDKLDPLHAELGGRNKGTFHVDPDDFGPLLAPHRRHDRADGAQHVFFGHGVNCRHKRSHTPGRKHFAHPENGIGRHVFRAVSSDPMDMRIDKTRGKVGTICVDQLDIGRECLLGKAPFGKNVGDQIAFHKHRTAVHARIARNDGRVMNAKG